MCPEPVLTGGQLRLVSTENRLRPATATLHLGCPSHTVLPAWRGERGISHELTTPAPRPL